jgi:DNA (cytosine-5)-methyltransferase 1
MERTIKILELFGGIGSPRCALRNIGVPVKAIDYVEIDEKAVRSYNAMFEAELEYQTQSVVGYNLKPDILIHGSPCQDFSIAGHQGKATAEGGRINRGKGADEGSGTRSSLMWETIHIIEQMGEWKPRYVIWENVKNVTSKHMIVNFKRYLREMEKLGYSNSYETLDAREFGLPQARERVFTISTLNGDPFDFSDLIKTPMRDIKEFLEADAPEVYTVTQPSVYNAIGKKGIRRATVIKDYAYTITARQDRTPAQVIDLGGGKYRYLTERECWRLQGYTDADFEAAAAVQKRIGRYAMALYKQAGNSIAVPIFESIFRKIILGETEETKQCNLANIRGADNPDKSTT